MLYTCGIDHLYTVHTGITCAIELPFTVALPYVLVTTCSQWRIPFTARDLRALYTLGSHAVKYAIRH